MIVLPIEQGSEEWKELRRECVTATDMCVIAADAGLCSNLFKKSIDTLIKDKINAKESQNNIYFELGHKFEKILFEQINAIDLIESEVILFDKNKRIMASLDARDSEINLVIEIKTTSRDISELDLLIDYYRFQVAHQCYVADAKAAIIVFGILKNGELREIRKVEINPKKVITKKSWLELCNNFLVKLDAANVAPAEDLKLWDEYNKINLQLKDLEAQLAKIKEAFIAGYPDGITYKEFSVKKSIRESTRYAEFIKDQQLSVSEKYKTSSISYTMKGNV